MKAIANFKNEWTTQLVESSHIAILVVNQDRQIIYVNSPLCELFGYSEDELILENTKLLHLSQENFKNFFHEAFKGALSGETVGLDYQFRKKDGTQFWGHISGKLIEASNEILWTLIDVSQITLAQDEINLLKDRNQLQSEMLDQIKDAIVMANMEGIITSWNKGSELIYGYTKEEIVGKGYFELFLEEDIPQHMKNVEILLSEGSFRGDLRFVKKDGSLAYVNASTSVLKDENGNATGTIGFSHSINERKEQEEKLKYQAEHDSLTNLPNRALFNDRLSQAIKKATRKDTRIALFFIDLDHFKEINDSLGHEIGDKVLQEVTSRLLSIMRDEDTLSRLGGDEFTVIIDDLEKSEDAARYAKKMLGVLSKPLEIGAHTLYVSCSIGISTYPDDGSVGSDLVKFADSAMYKAKNEGRNNYQFYSKELTALSLKRIVMEGNLRQAIKNKEFQVYYQAQVDAQTNTIVGAEALVRWIHPKNGIISPAEFIPLAESTGLITQIDAFVREEAMQQFYDWYEMGLNPGKLSLNLSVKQLKEEDFIRNLKSLMEKIGCEASKLELEVTEGHVMENPEESIKMLHQIRDLGISLSIDDFGTGYSSLAYLKKLPINKIKIDQSFVQGLPEDEEDAAIVKAVIAFAKSLNLKIIAEGVEEKAQRDFIVENGCQYIQGYYYSKPLPADEMKELIINGVSE